MSVTDLIDFEHQLLLDEKDDPLRRWQADREIFKTLLRKKEPAALNKSRAGVFLLWLERRRGKGHDLAGDGMAKIWKLIVSAFVLLALFAGVLNAGALIVLEEDGHVSTTKFLLVTVGLQIGLTVGSLLLWLGKSVLRLLKFGEFDSLRVVGVAGLFRWLRSMWNRTSTDPIVLLARLARKYHGIAVGHVAFATQLCFVALSVGLVVSLLAFHLAYRDVRFGWSTHYAWTPAGMSIAVSVIAAPWSWLAPWAKPTHEEISESHLTQDDVKRRVSAPASRAWASFLVSALIFYGLVLRLIFAGLALLFIRNEQKSVSFDFPAADDLWKRLTEDPRTQLRPEPIPPSALPEESPWWRKPIDWLMAAFSRSATRS